MPCFSGTEWREKSSWPATTLTLTGLSPGLSEHKATSTGMLLISHDDDFSSPFGVGRRIHLARDTNVGFRQMMQFWNPLIMRYHACDKALPVSLLLERRVDFYIWVLKGPPTKMCDAAARPCAATQSLTVARLQHKLQHKAATQIWGLCTYVAT